MRSMLPYALLCFALFSLAGWIVLFMSVVVRRRRQAREEAERAHATGTIVEYAGPSAKAVVRFDADGKEYRLECRERLDARRWPVGQSVEVRYDPDVPARFHLDMDERAPGAGRALILAGIAWIALSAALVLWLARDNGMELRHLTYRLRGIELFSTGSKEDKSKTRAGDYQYTLSENGLMAEINRYTGDDKTLTVPMIVDGHVVMGLAMGAFSGSRTLVSVTVPAPIESIPTAAFTGCVGLMEVTLEEGVRTIDKQAFGMCPSLRRVVLPASLVRIDDEAFPEDCAAVFVVAEGSTAQAYCQEKGFQTEIE